VLAPREEEEMLISSHMGCLPEIILRFNKNLLG